MFTSTTHSSRRSWGLRVACGVAWLALAALSGGVANAQTPAQKPLIKQLGNLPKSNVMLTLDSSWSMIFPYMPEGQFTVNSVSVTFPGFRSLVLDPRETRFDSTAAGCGFALTGITAANGTTAQKNDRITGQCGAVAGVAGPTATLFQRQMRSADVNTIYYNPRVRYRPWMIAAPSSRLADASYTAAVLDLALPASGTNVIDLSTTYAGLNAYWCTAMGAGQNAACPLAALNFNPGLYYVLGTNQSPTVAANFTEYDLNSSTASYTKYPNRIDCAATSCTQAEERRNYANWFVHYRTRLHLAQASLPESFLPLDDTFRLGWGTIHQGSASLDGAATAIVQQGVRDATVAQKTAMVNWLRGIRNGTTSPPLQGGTPLNAAMTGVGEYFSRSDARSPWTNDPAGGDSAVLSCRRSYHIMVTDGYYGDTNTVGDQDTPAPAAEFTLSGPNPAGGANLTFRYSAAAPYSDSTSNTIADIAMKYWKTDLSTAANRVNQTDTNPAFWQHLVQFPVGLGVFGNVNWPADRAALISGTKTWWGGTANENKVNDLIHAAVNSRGEFFSVKDSTELSGAISTALGKASGDSGVKEGGVAAAATSLTAGNRKYIPSYTSVKWTGEVEAYTLDANGVAGTTALWRASDRLPAHGSRNIFTWTGATAVPFFWASMTATRSEIASGSEDLVNYIRGERTHEGTDTTDFRVRSGLLPDFINSTPVYLRGNVNMGYEVLPSAQGGNAYAAFYALKAVRSPLLAIGGNGGMLHIFRDAQPSVTTVAPTDGAEVFAFVPRTVLPNLSKLSQQNYGAAANYHQYFVDGGLNEADYYTGSAWKNILVGTLGAGGKGIFALDVTPPTTPGAAPTLNASTVMWEKSSLDESDMGYITADPEIGMLPNGDWKVFLGNGYYSQDGKAVLLVVDVATGSIQKLTADSGTGNGLGGVKLIRNSSQQVVAAYAGDLKGNMWRFEFGTGARASWAVGFSGHPLVTVMDASGNRQPITAAPSFVSHVSGGNVVLFATGKLFADADVTDSSMQSSYGVWDRTVAGASSATTLPQFPYDGTTPRTMLVAQTISNTPVTGTTGGTFYTLSSNSVDWSSTQQGWYMDFTIRSRQRAIYPTVVLGDFVYISSIVPAESAAMCETSSGVGFNFLVNARTGGQATRQVLDTNNDGVINASDVVAGSFQTGADGGDTPLTRITGTAKDIRVSFQNTIGQQAAQTYCLVDCTPAQQRISDRVWRQLLNPPRP